MLILFLKRLTSLTLPLQYTQKMLRTRYTTTLLINTRKKLYNFFGTCRRL